MFGQILISTFAATVCAVQPSAPSPPEAPLRELPWGQLNFLHSTDTHGWHAGHLQEASYSADWGDYISFAEHMRARADKDGVDILLIDTGDRVEGNGLYDASEPKGKYTFDIVKEQEIDILCAGNHELYKANSSRNEFYITVPNFKGNYLASNLDVRKNGTNEFEALAPRYKTFKTKNLGIRIVAFGFMFNFQGSSNDSLVIPVQEAIKRKWFQGAIREKADLFLVTGHVPAQSEEFDMIFKAIREVRWDTPIFFVGGHTHIRDYRKYDSKAYAIESGRYMETIGFASINGLNAEKKELDSTKASLKFSRRYIDNNLYSYYAHTGLNKTTFPTKRGQEVTEQITAARKELKLDETHGCAPRNLWLARAPIEDNHSIFKWLQDEVLPDQFTDPDKNASPKIVISNTGAIRFDIFKGPFTRDTTYLIAPFTSGFRRIKNVDSAVAFKLLQVLNENAPVLQDLDPTLDPSLLMPPHVQTDIFPPSGLESSTHSNQQLFKDKPLTPGYTTKDDDGDDGDDTIHSPIQFYKVANCIQAEVNFPSDKKKEKVKKVDVVYNEFLEQWIIVALRFLGSEYDQEDTSDYLGGQSLTEIIKTWVEDNWPCDNKDEL